MKNRREERKRAHTGFSLIELMVTVLVIGILAAIAVPSYTSSVRKSRRTEAKTALLDLAAREERYYSTSNGAYSALASDLGYAAWGAVGNGYYTIAAPTIVAGTTTVLASYSITATAVGSQASDTGCLTFTISSTGLQSATGSDSANCWK